MSNTTLTEEAKNKVQEKLVIDPNLQQKLVCEEVLERLGRP